MSKGQNIVVILLVSLLSAEVGADRGTCGTAFVRSWFHSHDLPWPGEGEVPLKGPGGSKDLPQVGDGREFWAWDLNEMPPADILVPSTCRAVTEHLVVWVADSEWPLQVAQEDVDTIVEAFEEATPPDSMDPERGFYQIETELFGLPPDVDEDGHVHILLYPLGSFHGISMDGYFRASDEVEGSHSNRAEILFVDSRDPSSEYFLAVVAHEFQHMIHWAYDPDEVSWINESLSEVAMVAVGFYTDDFMVETYLQMTSSIPLMETEYVDYGACLLWGTYGWEQFGSGFLYDLVHEPANGFEGYSRTLQNRGEERDGAATFSDWTVANYLDAPQREGGRHGYTSIDIPMPLDSIWVSSYPQGFDRNLVLSAVEYVRFESHHPGTLHLQVSAPGDPSTLVAHLIALDPDHREEADLLEVDLSSGEATLSLEGLGAEWPKAVLALSTLDPRGQIVHIEAEAELQALPDASLEDVVSMDRPGQDDLPSPEDGAALDLPSEDGLPDLPEDLRPSPQDRPPVDGPEPDGAPPLEDLPPDYLADSPSLSDSSPSSMDASGARDVTPSLMDRPLEDLPMEESDTEVIDALPEGADGADRDEGGEGCQCALQG